MNHGSTERMSHRSRDVVPCLEDKCNNKIVNNCGTMTSMTFQQKTIFLI